MAAEQFNWDDHPIASKEVKPEEFDWNQHPIAGATQEAPKSSALGAAGIGAQNSLLFGLRPVVGGIAGSIGSGIGTYLGARNRGEDVGSSIGQAFDEAKSSYEPSRKEAYEEQENASSEHPVAYGAGSLGGAIATAPLIPAKGLKGAAALGAGMGAAESVSSGKTDASDVVKSGLIGAGTGLVLHKGMEKLGGSVTKGLKNSADSAQEFADAMAMKTSGGMLKDFRLENDKVSKGVDSLGKFALDNGIVQAGDKVQDVAEKSTAFRKKAGDALSSIYSKANKAIEDNAASLAKDVTPGETKLLTSGGMSVPEKLTEKGFNPSVDKPEILKRVKESLGNKEGKAAAVSKVEAYLDQLVEDHGDNLLDPKTANDIKSSIDQSINYARNPLNPDPVKEQAFKELRTYVNEKILDHIDDIGKKIGDPELASKLKEANKNYGFSKSLERMSGDRVARNEANRMFGLTDTIAGGAGMAAGAATHGTPGALVGLGAGLVNKLGRTYGPGIIASGANKAAPILEKTAVPLGNAIENNPGLLRAVRKGLIQNGTKSSQGLTNYFGGDQK